MSSWDKLLEEAEPRGHLVHLYKCDEGLLTKNVANYIRGGLDRGDTLLFIATKERSQEVSRRLQDEGIDLEDAVRQGSVVSRDAQRHSTSPCLAGVWIGIASTASLETWSARR